MSHTYRHATYSREDRIPVPCWTYIDTSNEDMPECPPTLRACDMAPELDWARPSTEDGYSVFTLDGAK